MLIKDKKENICNHLDIVEKALPSKTTMHVLNHIFLEIKPEEITFLTTNLEMGIKTTYGKEVEVEEDGKVLLPPRFIDVIKSLPQEEVSIDINIENKKIEIESGSSKFNLTGMGTEEYPVFFEKEPEEDPVLFTGSELKDIIRKTIFAVSKDESRPVFTGVLFSIENNTLSVISSDTYRLVMQEKPLSGWGYGDGSYIIPGKSLRELYKLLKDDSRVAVFPQDNQLAFSFDNIYFYSRLIDEKYPEVKGVIPQKSVTRCLVNKEILENTLNRASLLVDHSTQAAKIVVNEENMEIKASSNIGIMEEQLSLNSKEGEELEIYVNVRFILEVLRVIDKENILIVFSGKEAPCIIKPEEDESFLYLVLPIKIE